MTASAPAWERAARWAVARHRPFDLDHDDALQLARLEAWRAAERWDPAGGVAEVTWCYRRAVGAFRDHVRSVSGLRAGTDRPGRPRPIALDDLPGLDPPAPPDRSADLEYRELADDILERLPPHLWETAVRIAYGDRAVDIARADGVSESAVTYRCRTIRRALTTVA